MFIFANPPWGAPAAQTWTRSWHKRGFWSGDLWTLGRHPGSAVMHSPLAGVALNRPLATSPAALYIVLRIVSSLVSIRCRTGDENGRRRNHVE